MEYPLTLAGIEPATFQFIAQHLNHCATAVPDVLMILYIIHTALILATIYPPTDALNPVYKKVKQSHYRPGVAQRVPGS